MTCVIKRSIKGPYYEMEVNGEFEGNYDSPKEAADAFEEIRKEKEELSA